MLPMRQRFFRAEAKRKGCCGAGRWDDEALGRRGAGTGGEADERTTRGGSAQARVT